MTTFSILESSTRTDECFFSVAITTPFEAFIPIDVIPWDTAVRACSIWTSFPEGENVVREKEYRSEWVREDDTSHLDLRMM
jgi:hypothetical protein